MKQKQKQRQYQNVIINLGASRRRTKKKRRMKRGRKQASYDPLRTPYMANKVDMRLASLEMAQRTATENAARIKQGYKTGHANPPQRDAKLLSEVAAIREQLHRASRETRNDERPIRRSATTSADAASQSRRPAPQLRGQSVRPPPPPLPQRQSVRPPRVSKEQSDAARGVLRQLTSQRTLFSGAPPPEPAPGQLRPQTPKSNKLRQELDELELKLRLERDERTRTKRAVPSLAREQQDNSRQVDLSPVQTGYGTRGQRARRQEAGVSQARGPRPDEARSAVFTVPRTPRGETPGGVRSAARSELKRLDKSVGPREAALQQRERMFYGTPR